MQRYINLDSSHPLHSLLLQHHVNKQENGVEPAVLHAPITSPPQPGVIQSFVGSPVAIVSPMFHPLDAPAPVAKQSGRIVGTFANLFARKGSQ